MPSLILYNGKFITQDLDFPQVTAVAIRQDRFLALGDDAEILTLAGPHTRSIDLEGHLVLPGLVDAHFHYRKWALERHRLRLAEATSLSDLRQRLAEKAREVPPGQWIVAMGWSESRWPEGRMPSRADLDAAAPAQRVVLWRYDGHLAVVNSRALEEVGITEDTPDPPGGIIDRDETGQPTGILRDQAINVVNAAIPPPAEEDIVAAMREGFPVLHRLGLTGVHDMGLVEGAPLFRPWQLLRAAGELPLRAWVAIPAECLDEAVALGLRTGFGDEYLAVGPLKLFADGSQGARTAWMLEPYKDDGLGLPTTPPEELADAIRRADEAGISVAVHAIGDRANREVLDIFQRLKSSGRARATAPPANPHRIEHVQNIRLEDLSRLAQLGIVASVQPVHLVDDLPVVEQSVGSRARFTYAFRDMWATGVRMAFGSDCPVAGPNPLWGIHAAVTRRQRDGNPPGGWYPAQRLTVGEAVWGFTMGPALAAGRQADLGSITPGKLADLVVLDRDIRVIEPMEIANVQIVMTVLGGQVVHER
ncbi:MAG: amidohydrolase [Anaerolineae bacterium]|nr:amidohydrolase [Anaerolineae bacterium]